MDESQRNNSRCSEGRMMQQATDVLANQEPMGGSHWHAIPADTVLCRLSSSEDGLSSAEAERRLAACGANRLPSAPAIA
jgi:hypothetical protein